MTPALLTLLPTLLLAAIGLSPGLERLIARYPADSLLAPLRRYEVQQRRGAGAAEAAFVLGQLHLARAEYRLAADAFSRAAAGFDPARQDEARYWAGISWLAVPNPERARALLEEVEQRSGPRRWQATLGVAVAWTLEDRLVPAYRVLSRVVARGDPETTPAALERLAQVAERLDAPDVARRARERLRREYPRSFEAIDASPGAGP